MENASYELPNTRWATYVHESYPDIDINIERMTIARLSILLVARGFVPPKLKRDMVPILIQHLYESHSIEFENEVNKSDMSWSSRATKLELPRVSSRGTSPLPRVSSRGSSRVSSRAPSRAGSDDDEWAYSGEDASIPWYPRF